VSQHPFEQSPLQQITGADGIAKEIRIQDGHLFVCHGCCCGRTEKGFPLCRSMNLSANGENAAFGGAFI
jgi:hypothetical protein